MQPIGSVKDAAFPVDTSELQRLVRIFSLAPLFGSVTSVCGVTTRAEELIHLPLAPPSIALQ